MQRPMGFGQRVQRLIRRFVWAMDIDASAWIAPTALIDRTWPKGVHIGAGCVLGEEVVVLCHDLTRGLYLDTRIGDGTLVGARAIVLPGITVGRNCVIQPGALVNRDVPDDHIAEGNPAISRPR